MKEFTAPLNPSTNVRDSHYDEDTGVLHVRFHNGNEYEYHDVPAEKHQAFLEADSAGGFVHEHLKSHPYVRIA